MMIIMIMRMMTIDNDTHNDDEAKLFPVEPPFPLLLPDDDDDDRVVG